MTPDQINDLINKLLETGKFLGTKAFELAVRQTYFEGTANTIIGLLFLIVAGICIYIAKRMIFDDWDEDFAFVPIIVVVGSFAISPFFLYDGIAKLVNPEWYAIKLLLSTFLGL